MRRWAAVTSSTVKAQLLEEAVHLGFSLRSGHLSLPEPCDGTLEVNFLGGFSGVNVTGDVQVPVVLLDLIERNNPSVSLNLLPCLEGADDLLNILTPKRVLVDSVLELPGGIDE